MPLSELRRRLPYLLYRAGRWVATAIPQRALEPFAAAAGALAARLLTRKRVVVRRNLSRVVALADLERHVQRAFRSYARYWIETLRLPRPGLPTIAARTTTRGLEELTAVIRQGRGVIFVVPHLGSWDVAGAWVAAQGWRCVTVAERLEPPQLYELFRRIRAECGLEIHPAGTGATARVLLQALRNGAVVPLLGDRDISGSGVDVEFFGERTRLPAGPAVLATRTGAPLAVGAFLQRPRGRYEVIVLDPIAVEPGRADQDGIRSLTQRIARDMETLIRADPGQWHLFQPNWPSDPGYSRTPED